MDGWHSADKAACVIQFDRLTGLLPKASLSDHPPPRCDDDCYDSTDKGQSKMSQAMVDRWRVHRIWRNERARENELEVVTSYHISKKDNMTFAKKTQVVIFLLMSLCLAPSQWSTVVDLFWAQ